MRSFAFPLSALALTTALAGVGCTPKPAPPPPIEESYPSPDYSAQDANAVANPVVAPRPAHIVLPPPPEPTSPRTARKSTPPSRPAGAPPPALPFDTIDTDRNGRIPLEEWRQFQDKEFRRLDKNNDGVLTRDELAVPASPSPAQ